MRSYYPNPFNFDNPYDYYDAVERSNSEPDPEDVSAWWCDNDKDYIED